jgi:hypothetical protein
MSRVNTRLALMVGVVAAGVPVSGLTAQSQQQPAACTASAYRQFDFWIGDWEVTNPQGAVAGENTIRSILSGCVLHEHWRGAGGGSGQSHNIYDLRTGKWHQTWVDSSGQLLLLDGGIEDGKMVLRGETVGQNGQTTLNEISWEPLDGGRVRQLWRSSTDAGTSWQVVFDGLYTKKQ